jgi:hypothetical protein
MGKNIFFFLRGVEREANVIFEQLSFFAVMLPTNLGPKDSEMVYFLRETT